MQQYLEAGKVVTTHGVRGEMKLELWCDGVDFLKKTGRLYASAKGGKCYNIISIRPQGQMALLQLEGVNDMDAARALRGQVFYFDRSDATLPGHISGKRVTMSTRIPIAHSSSRSLSKSSSSRPGMGVTRI